MITSLVAQMEKYLPAMQETRVPSLGWEDTLEKEMATHSSTLAWKIPWTEEPGRLQSIGLQGVGHDWATPLSHYDYTVEMTSRFKGLDLIDRIPEEIWAEVHGIVQDTVIKNIPKKKKCKKAKWLSEEAL